MHWRLGACALVIVSQAAAGADSSVGQPSASDPGWCVGLYLKETKRPAPKPMPPASAKQVSFDLGAVTVQLELPAALVAGLVDRELVQVGAGGAGSGDQFGDWDPTLQVRWQTRAELEARVKAIQSDFMGTTRARIDARAASFQGSPAEELCAIVLRTPGHATTVDGRHHAMGDIVELVHGYLFSIGDKTLGAAYRLPPREFDQQPRWERVLDSIRLANAAVEMIVVFNKNVTRARGEQILKEMGFGFHEGSDSSHGKQYFYAHGPQFSVRVPEAELAKFRAHTKKRTEIFEAYPADRTIRKD